MDGWAIVLGAGCGVIGCMIALWVKAEAMYWQRRAAAIESQLTTLRRERSAPVVEPPMEPEPAPEPEPGASDEEIAARITAMAADGLSNGQIEEHVFGYRGGAAYTIVRRVLATTTAQGDVRGVLAEGID